MSVVPKHIAERNNAKYDVLIGALAGPPLEGGAEVIKGGYTYSFKLDPTKSQDMGSMNATNIYGEKFDFQKLE